MFRARSSLRPERVPIRYLARILAAVWIGAAVLYWISKLDELTKTRSRIAMACVVALDLFLVFRSRPFRSWLWDNTSVSGRDRCRDRASSRAGRHVLVAGARDHGPRRGVADAQEYIGDRKYFEKLFPVAAVRTTRSARSLAGLVGVQSPFRYYHELAGFAWWSGWRVLGYVVMPVMLILAWPGYRLRDVHIRFEGFFRHLWIYVFLFALVLPAVLYASTTDAFRHTYPFYRLANRSRVDCGRGKACTRRSSSRSSSSSAGSSCRACAR